MQSTQVLKLFEIGRRGRPVTTIGPGDLAEGQSETARSANGPGGRCVDERRRGQPLGSTMIVTSGVMPE